MGPDITLRGMVQRFQTELRKQVGPTFKIRVMAQRFCTVQGTHIHTHGSGHYLERHSSESSDTLENTHTQVRGHTLMGPDITLRGMVQRFQTELRKQVGPTFKIRVMAQRFCTVQGTHIHTHGSGHYLERHGSESSDTLENTHTQVRGHTLMGPDITLRGMVQR
ncbi:hypothetical protein RRG08_031863, partial [Elysia crispata]